MDEGKGGDLMKTVLGILLLAAGSFLALNSFPDAQVVTLMANGQVQISPSAGDLNDQMATGYKMLASAVLALNGGGLLLFWSGRKGSA